jgi:hypothetical protein
MLVVAFVRWWYGAGWTQVNKTVRRRLQRTAASFSAPTLVRTLFAPWKRIIAAPGAGIDAHIRAMGDNAVSRAVGFTVRLTVLLSAGVSLVFVALAGLLEVILWPLVPVLAVAFIVGGLL